MVVLQTQGQRKKRRMAYRLFYGVRELKRQVEGRCKIHTEVMGSDHCPVELDIEI